MECTKRLLLVLERRLHSVALFLFLECFFFFSKHTRTNEGMDEGMNRWESERADWIELHWIRV